MPKNSMRMSKDIYRNTNVPHFVQARSLHGIEVVDNGGLRQGLRAGRSGLEPMQQKKRQSRTR